MEVIGGFMMMLSIVGFFLAVIWFVLPFVVLSMKGKQERMLEILERIDLRLEALERKGGSATPGESLGLPPGEGRGEGASAKSFQDPPD
jgi:hypothetical protein